jgi:hypothetical protein
MSGTRRETIMFFPNTWASAVFKNSFGTAITQVRFQHRYDLDHFDSLQLPILREDTTTDPISVGYWTGLLRTGRDYWFVSFVADGQLWFCKDNFYCFLTPEDAGGTVVCEVSRDGDGARMRVDCPRSSDCTVSLHSNSSKPNSWATASIRNGWGGRIVNIMLRHRYDDDHMDQADTWWIEDGGASNPLPVGFWTGFGRTGRDF